MNKILIIVPCYNEEERLKAGEFIHEASRHENLHFLFVDDGSTDGTRARLRALREENPRQLDHISLEKNSGKAEAVRRGFLKALADGYEVIGYWDADLATPLSSIESFYQKILDNGTDVVIGARVKLLGRKIVRRAGRHYLGRVFATIASISLGLPIYDTQCGAKMFKKTDSLVRALQKPFTVNWTFDVELFARLGILEKARGDNNYADHWVEYPLETWEDVKGSKVRSKDFLKGGMEILKIFFTLKVPFLLNRYKKRHL